MMHNSIPHLIPAMMILFAPLGAFFQSAAALLQGSEMDVNVRIFLVFWIFGGGFKKNTSTRVTKMCSGVGDMVALKGFGGKVRGPAPICDRIWVNSADRIRNLN